MTIQLASILFSIIWGIGAAYFLRELIFHRYNGPESRNMAIIFALLFGSLTAVFIAGAFS